DRRVAAHPRARDAVDRARDDPGRAARAARRDRGRVRERRRDLPVRAPRDRPRPTRRARFHRRVNSVSVEADTAKGARSRTFVARRLAAVPIAGLCLLVFSFYLVEAWTRKTPWLFTDELEWTQLSRSIASTGHAARRGEPIFWKSLYAWVIAPFWWIHSTQAAYNGIKYLNA